jgi:hypothetical protein
MRKQKLQSLSIFTGSLLALAIVCSQLFNFNTNISSKKEVKTEQQENNSHSSEEALISLPSFSLPTPVHVQSNLDSYCLFEILFEKHNETVAPSQAPSYPTKFLITLFRAIISPNAP